MNKYKKSSIYNYETELSLKLSVRCSKTQNIVIFILSLEFTFNPNRCVKMVYQEDAFFFLIL